MKTNLIMTAGLASTIALAFVLDLILLQSEVSAVSKNEIKSSLTSLLNDEKRQANLNSLRCT